MLHTAILAVSEASNKGKDGNMNSNVNIDIDAIIQSIYGCRDLLESLAHAAFQVPLRESLTGNDMAKFEFLEANYGFLTGSIQTLSGTIRILSDALLSGDVEILPSHPYHGLEAEQLQSDIIDMACSVGDAEVLRKIYTFTKTLIEG